MAYYQYHVMRFLSNRFLQRSRYMDIDMSHNAYKPTRDQTKSNIIYIDFASYAKERLSESNISCADAQPTSTSLRSMLSSPTSTTTSGK